MNRLERLMRIAKKPSRRVVGLMSGTSLDAIDAAMVRIKGHGSRSEVELEEFRSYPFPPKIRMAVRDLFDPKRARVDQICRYDFILGELFARVHRTASCGSSRPLPALPGSDQAVASTVMPPGPRRCA